MNKARVAAMEAVYARVPRIACRRLCIAACGPINYSRLEAKRIEKRTHRLPLADDSLTCNMLELGSCSVYDIRPLICRLFGVVDIMRCPHGCRPDRLLSDAEAKALLREAARIGGVRAENCQSAKDADEKRHQEDR